MTRGMTGRWRLLPPLGFVLLPDSSFTVGYCQISTATARECEVTWRERQSSQDSAGGGVGSNPTIELGLYDDYSIRYVELGPKALPAR